MTLKILEILLDGISLGNIKLSGPTGTKLQKARIESPYNEWLTNMGLLTKEKDYSFLGFEGYISNLKECLNKNSGKEIIIKEKKLHPNIEKLLIQHYSQK